MIIIPERMVCTIRWPLCFALAVAIIKGKVWIIKQRIAIKGARPIVVDIGMIVNAMAIGPKRGIGKTQHNDQGKTHGHPPFASFLSMINSDKSHEK